MFRQQKKPAIRRAAVTCVEEKLGWGSVLPQPYYYLELVFHADAEDGFFGVSQVELELGTVGVDFAGAGQFVVRTQA